MIWRIKKKINKWEFERELKNKKKWLRNRVFEEEDKKKQIMQNEMRNQSEIETEDQQKNRKEKLRDGRIGGNIIFFCFVLSNWKIPEISQR